MDNFLERLSSDNLTEKRPFLFGLTPEQEPVFIPEKNLYIYWTYQNVRELMISSNLSIAKKYTSNIESSINWKEAFIIENNQKRNETLINKAKSISVNMFVGSAKEHNYRKKIILDFIRDINRESSINILKGKANSLIKKHRLNNSIDLKSYASDFIIETIQYFIGNGDRKLYEAIYIVYEYYFTFNKSATKMMIHNQKVIYIVKNLISMYDSECSDKNSLWYKMQKYYSENKIHFDSFIGDIIAVIGAAMESSLSAICNQMNVCFQEKHHFKKDFENDLKFNEFINRVNILEPPANYIVRNVIEDFKFNNTTLKKGTQLFLFIPFANREVMEKMNKIPNSKQGCQFGRGRHYCIGSDIAEIEIHVALKEIIKAFQNTEVKVIGQRKSNIKFRNFENLSLQF